MHRFYVPPDRISDDHIIFTPDQRRQIKSVLRLRPGDVVAVFDGSGAEYATRIERLDSEGAHGLILEVSRPDTEPPRCLVLAQALPKGQKLDFVLQKGTEIGVSEFVIMRTARSVPQIPADKIEPRLERWKAIIREAAEQSGRTRLPFIRGVIPFFEALSVTSECDVRLLACENASFGNPDPFALVGTASVACFIGPEGGFTAEEVRTAENAGLSIVSLGPRTLRTETAALVMASLLIYSPERTSV